MSTTDNNFIYKSRLMDLGLVPSSQNVSTFQYFLGVGLLALTIFCYLILFSFCAYVMLKGARVLVNLVRNRFGEDNCKDTRLLLSDSRKCSHPLSAIVVPTEFSLEEGKRPNSILVVPRTNDTNFYCSNEESQNHAVAIIMPTTGDEKKIIAIE